MGLSHKLYLQMNKTAAVRNATRRRAEVVAGTAQRISNSEGGTASFSVESGIRPGGRAYANVVSDNRDEEYGTETTPRIRALGRAARAR